MPQIKKKKFGFQVFLMRTTNIDFNFDDENNLELYEIGSNDETYTISKINEIVKSKKAFQQN